MNDTKEQLLERLHKSEKAVCSIIPVDYRNGEIVTAFFPYRSTMLAMTSWGRCWSVIDARGKVNITLIDDTMPIGKIAASSVRPMTPREETVARFIAERVDGDNPHGFTLPFLELWDTYTQWLHENGIEWNVSRTAFGRFMRKYVPGYASTSNRGNRFVNVTLKPHANQSPLPL